jgi:hypothetical protein
MDQPAADELVGMEGHDAGLAGVAVRSVEADVDSLVVADDALGADGAALHIMGEVAEGDVAAPTCRSCTFHVLAGRKAASGWEA